MSEEFCEIIIKYKPRKMPPTSLIYLTRDIEAMCNRFTPPIKVTVQSSNNSKNQSSLLKEQSE